MPRLTKQEWKLVNIACYQLWNSLDITNNEIKDRSPKLYEQNKKDMETLDRIMNKINLMEGGKNDRSNIK